MAVTAVDTRTAALAQILSSRFASATPQFDAVEAAPLSTTPSSNEVIRELNDLLDLSHQTVTAELPVLDFETAAFSEYLNITASLLKAGTEGLPAEPSPAAAYGPDAQRFNPSTPVLINLQA